MGCAREEEFENFRNTVRNELRDPHSAEFRNETVRTLWTRGGKRLTVYCGEVNSANELGGKTGFIPVQHVVSNENLDPYVAAIWKPGTVYIHEDGPSPNYYLNCQRADTERDEEFGKPIVFHDATSTAGRAEMDRLWPVLSKETAP